MARLGTVWPSGDGQTAGSAGSFSSIVDTGAADLRGLVASTTGITKVGTTATTGHALTTGDVIFGGAVEIDGMLWVDGGVSWNNGNGLLTSGGAVTFPTATHSMFGSYNFSSTAETATFASFLRATKGLLTAGTMTQTNTAEVRTIISRYDWTNAMVTALPTTAGDIAVCTLPAKTIVTNAYVVITGAAAGPATVTVALGRTGATYIDYIVASDAKAAANTVYGDASAERGTNLTGYDLPSFTGTTVVNAHFISTGANLSTVTGSSGSVYLETMVLP